MSRKAKSCIVCPHDVPNRKGMVPECTQYAVAKTVLSVTIQLHTTERLVYMTSLEVQNMNDAVKNHDTVHQWA